MKLIIACVIGLLAHPALAETACAPRDVVISKLADGYGETRRGIGIEARGGVVEVFAAESGSWTIIVTAPNGISCVVASGQAYEDLSEALPAQGDPT